ncbi:helix-turn-helix transcriptional regulator [Amycolatopsis albispora]|uniref:Helix-turn-helix transcriptional regulator n=2 Tax=Amycolatopsis albispora TaxID=1804986 RepID=A0A344LLL6_9PSEU|nr:response regulator transcription factor [Amycolatopsis albispora]AXB48940.1 helix-turn-helix transcriptional regulator [Amycolatopsis albispora]
MTAPPIPPVTGGRGFTVAAVESVPIFRDGLSALIQRSHGMTWVGHAANHHTALQLCEQLRPEMILLDSGLDPNCHLTRLLASAEHPPIVVVLIREATRTSRYLTAAIGAGARAAVPRSAEPRRVIEAMRRAHLETRYVDPALAALAARPKRQPAADGRPATGPRAQMPLSRREYQVLQLIAEGMENSAIAKVLYLSVETVRTHVKSILRKLSARDRTHAVTTAFRSGILITHADDSATCAQLSEATPPAK